LSDHTIQNSIVQLVEVSKATPRNGKDAIKAFPAAGSQSTSDIIITGDLICVFEQTGIGKTAIDMASTKLQKWRV